MPSSLRLENDTEEQIQKRIESTLSIPDFAQEIAEWDLFNEPFTVPDLLGETALESVPEWFRRARELAPNCRFVVNQNELLPMAGLRKETLNATRNLMSLISTRIPGSLGLGLQCHLRGLSPDGNKTLECLQALSHPDWDSRITELDVAGGTSEAFEDFLTAVFSWPSMTGLNL